MPVSTGNLEVAGYGMARLASRLSFGSLVGWWLVCSRRFRRYAVRTAFQNRSIVVWKRIGIKTGTPVQLQRGSRRHREGSPKLETNDGLRRQLHYRSFARTLNTSSRSGPDYGTDGSSPPAAKNPSEDCTQTRASANRRR
jgi:hypothetical protein